MEIHKIRTKNYYIAIKCLRIAMVAKIDHPILNNMIVGRVLMVDDHIRAKLETKANINSHHHCFPNKRPGNIMQSLVIKAKNSTLLALFQ